MAETMTAPAEAENTAPVDVTDADVDAFFESGGELPARDETPEAENEPDGQADEVREQAQQGQEDGAEEAEAEQEVKQQEKTVPYGALHEERQLRKEAKAEAQELRDKMARMEERFQMFQAALKPAEPEVSFEDDPAEYLRKQSEQTQQTLEAMKKQQEEQASLQKQQNDYNNFLGQYQAAAKQYSEQHPEFQDAYTHLVQGRVKEHVLAGFTEAEATQMANREEQAIVRLAFEQGANPAERLVELAKIRGWKAVAADAGTASPKVDKVDQVAKGQAEAKTISKGGEGESKLTLEALADMDGDDFDKAWTKLFGADD